MSRALRMTEEQYAQRKGRPFPASGILAPKPSKYRARPCGAYASKKEARRAAELKMLEKAGQIRNLREQVSYELIPRQCVGGKLVERECRYICDFAFDEWHDGTDTLLGWFPVVEDCKGVRTKDYIIKRKLMLHVHGIRIRET